MSDAPDGAPLVDEATVVAAHHRAAARGLSETETRRWEQVRAWAAGLPAAARDLAAAAPLLDVFTGHHRDPEGGPPAVDMQLRDRLAAWFAARGTTVTSMSVIAGGFSRLMLDVSWRDRDGRDARGVVRIEQDGMFATEGGREVQVMQAVARYGYPVPAVLWQEPDPAAIGHPFFVMAHVAGAARTDDAGLDDMVRAVADLHRLDAAGEVAAIDGVTTVSGDATIRAQLDHWHSVYRDAVTQPIPALEQSFDWLERHLHPTGPPVVVHGDPGPGNALQNETGVTAVIDWEFAHAGDAAEDWAYLALIRGRRLGGPADWKARLSRVAGIDYDDATWQAWEAYNQVKGACVNLTALEVFRRSAAPTPDLLAIGVAVHLRFLARAVELTG